MSIELINALVELREADAINLTLQMLSSGEQPEVILNDARQAMERVGKNFEEKQYFLPELMMAGEIMKQISDKVRPYLAKDIEVDKIGKIVFGTVAGDIHDIGKDIVALMLNVYGFELIDLGVDVPSTHFIDVVKEVDAPILGLSGFLYLAHRSMKETIDLLENEGLRRKVKVMIGGGQVDENVMKVTGADAWGRDAMDAVNIARKWIEEAGEHGRK